MCVAFDHTGRYIVAVRKSHPPVLYHIDRDTSLAEFIETGYGNTVTRKSVCFAGQKDEVRIEHCISDNRLQSSISEIENYGLINCI